MPRHKRYDWTGCRHHVMNRGARHKQVFHNDTACATFIELLSEVPKRYGILIHAYALMPNHYHLLVESTRGQLSRAMSFIGSCYTRWVNSQNPGWDGALFRGRFHSVDVSREDHWYYLPIYIHLNPVRAGLVGHITQSRWTSHGVYAGNEAVPEWLCTHAILNQYGGCQGYLKALDELVLGRQEPPENFDQVTLHPYVRTPKTPAKSSSLSDCTPTDKYVLKAVATVCGVKQNTLKQTKRGRAGNMPRKLAAYWLTMGAGLKLKKTSELLNMHPARISQAIRGIRSKMQEDNDLSATMVQLEQKILNC